MKEAEDDENVEEEDVPVEKTKKVSHAKRKKQTQCKLTWIGEPVKVFFPPHPLLYVCMYVMIYVIINAADKSIKM